MKKKKVWVYAVVGILIISAIVLIITLYPKAKEKLSDDNFKKSSVTITLKTPQTISILKGNTAEIPIDLIVVEPSSKASELTSEVVVLSNGVENGITFENNLIGANFVGEYAIKFKVPKDDSSFVTKQQKVVVHENESLCHVTQVECEFYITEQPNINTVFSISSGLNYVIETSSGLALNQNILTAIDVGTYSIKFTFTDVGVKYFYNFEVRVLAKELEEYKISVIGVENDLYTFCLTDFSQTLGYDVTKSGNLFGVNQSVNANSDNNNVVIVEVIGEGFIYLQAISVGEANVTLTCLLDNSVTYTFKIVIT